MNFRPGLGAAELQRIRSEFDLSFALAPQQRSDATVNFLSIRVGEQLFAILTTSIMGIHADRPITSIPTSAPSLLGVAGFRGMIVPVHDLAALLGQTRQSAVRWLVMIRPNDPVAFAFESVEAHFTVLPEQIVATQSGTAAVNADSAQFDAVRVDNSLLPIIKLQSLLHPLHQSSSSTDSWSTKS